MVKESSSKHIFSVLSFPFTGKIETLGKFDTEEQAQEKAEVLMAEQKKALKSDTQFYIVHHLATA